MVLATMSRNNEELDQKQVETQRKIKEMELERRSRIQSRKHKIFQKLRNLDAWIWIGVILNILICFGKMSRQTMVTRETRKQE